MKKISACPLKRLFSYHRSQCHLSSLFLNSLLSCSSKLAWLLNIWLLRPDECFRWKKVRVLTQKAASWPKNKEPSCKPPSCASDWPDEWGWKSNWWNLLGMPSETWCRSTTRHSCTESSELSWTAKSTVRQGQGIKKRLPQYEPTLQPWGGHSLMVIIEGKVNLLNWFFQQCLLMITQNCIPGHLHPHTTSGDTHCKIQNKCILLKGETFYASY